MAEIGTDLHQAIQLLQDGELVAIPTETVYGLAGNALNAEAVAKIFIVKKRPQFDPLIIHIPAADKLPLYTRDVPPMALRLAEKFWPGPLTLVLQKKPMIHDLVTAGLDTVGVRCPNHPLTASLLRSLDFPLAAPSANPFGYVSPTTASHVNEQLGNDINLVLDGGPCTIGIESTIVGFENDVAVIYRIGGLSVEDIESVTGKAIIQPYSTSNPKAPGQLKSHYAPTKKIILGEISELLQHYPAHDIGLLTFTTDYNSPYQRILSAQGSLEEAARNLFAALRSFDQMPVEFVLAEPVPDMGIGRAINDRLRRAATDKDS